MKLNVSQLSGGYAGATVVSGCSFELPKGRTLAVLGKNGMGKSTMIKAMLGLLPQRSGRVELNGHDVSSLPGHQLMRFGIGYAPQEAAIFPDLSVGENLRLGSLKLKDFDQRRDEVLAEFPVLLERLRQQAGTLSGGEQKMLILARTLIPRPSVLVLDEITEGLQPSVLDRARSMLQRELEERQPILVLVEQNIDFALALADDVLLLHVGSPMFSAPSGAPEVRERITEAFLM